MAKGFSPALVERRGKGEGESLEFIDNS